MIVNHFCNVDVTKSKRDTGKEYGPISVTDWALSTFLVIYTQEKRTKQILEHSYQHDIETVSRRWFKELALYSMQVYGCHLQT